jgi:hypothetical protein
MRKLTFASAVIALVLALSGCGGGGSSGSPGAAAPPSNGSGNTPPPHLPSSLKASSGAVIGADNLFTPNDGDTASGGNGQLVDGIPCKATMDEIHYHVHAFVGIVANGVLVALPDGVGMKNPGPDSSAGVTSTATCFYYLHTHDASGIMHIEDPSTASRTVSLHKLGQFLDIWGQPFSGNGVGPFTGEVKIYTSGAKYRGQGPQTVGPSTYTQYTGSAAAVPLYAHEVIWIEIGPTFVAPQTLPSIQFTY